MSKEPRRTYLPFPWPTGTYEEEREDGFALVQAVATADDLARYEAALKEDPDDDEVREFYASGLYYHGRRAEAVIQARLRADRAEPGSHHHFTLAAWLRETGDPEGALAVFEAMRPHRTSENVDASSRAVFRWGLAETLEALGRTGEAIQELLIAVALLEAAVREQRASPQLLWQIRGELERLSNGGAASFDPHS